MPKNVRPFWIETKVDGGSAPKGTGPKSGTGGFRTVILMREKGSVAEGVVITGDVVTRDGERFCRLWLETKNEKGGTTSQLLREVEA